MSEETIKIAIDTIEYYKNKKTARELEEVPIDILRCMYLDLLHNVKQLEKQNIILKYQDIPYLEGQIKGYKARIEELKLNQCDHNISNECIRKSVIRDKIEELENEIKNLLSGVDEEYKQGCKNELEEYFYLCAYKRLLGDE